MKHVCVLRKSQIARLLFTASRHCTALSATRGFRPFRSFAHWSFVSAKLSHTGPGGRSTVQLPGEPALLSHLPATESRWKLDAGLGSSSSSSSSGSSLGAGSDALLPASSSDSAVEAAGAGLDDGNALA